jgi:hypothetical protein
MTRRNAATMMDCHVCQLPMEVQGRMDLDGEDWVALLCVDGHFTLLRESELGDVAPEKG